MTVGELIEKLKEHPPNQEIRICDADTNWFLELTEIESEITEYNPNGYLLIGGNYQGAIK